ncbi:MAG: bifunctional nuclease family protein [Armatimonadetes bacterium]|nr:bifunctional nuclease family protein [Armatimonadota bacterium]
MPEDFPEGSGEYESPPSFFPYDESSPIEDHPGDYGPPVEVQVEAVYMTQTPNQSQQFVLLTDGERKLPIVIGPFEATSITLALDGQYPDRPMTHDLMRTLIERMGYTVDRIVIDDLWGTTYYAKIYVVKDEEESEIDSRPSDAIALAVRFEAPIYVADGILDQASHT